MNTSTTKQRRSLKGTLRTILLKCRRQASDDLSTVGSGILRKDPSIPNLPSDSTAAFLLGLETVQHDEEDDIPDRFDISSLATSAAMSSTRTLMPKMSLSHFDTYHPPIQETKFLARGRHCSVSSSLGEGASYQASLISSRSFRSTSTLRIQSSSQSLRSESEASFAHLSFPERLDHDFSLFDRPTTAFECPSPPQQKHTLSPKRSLLRKRPSFGNVSSPSPLRQIVQPAFELDALDEPRVEEYPIPYDYSSRFSRPLSVIEEVASHVDEPLTPCQSPGPFFVARSVTPRRVASPLARTPSIRSYPPDLPRSVKYFSSFCALDRAVCGSPVTATSKELKYIFEIGENFCLNSQKPEEVSMDVITGSDAAGNPVTHLVFFSPLIIPHSGRSRFTLASMVDVTDFLHDNASVPELELISEEPAESDPPTPRSRPQPSPKFPKYQLSAENLLGGCFVDEAPQTPMTKDDDIWINIATEERRQYSQRSKSSYGSRTPSSATSTLSSSEGILEDFVGKLQELHSDFFLLAKSPLDDNYYEICNVSPRVYNDRDYVDGHLSKTSVTDMSKLSTLLTGDDAFDMEVRWGTQGLLKRMYSIPLFARSAVTWICFLVDPGLPVLW